ncbi:nicastrin [Galendromus occidentalis]|uniref:Nicastrin n=1 Tax=Galendromus occidentalis TaxID=34638 RepID=A0AAJ6QPL3_9ACAR|nr:nicastrin [Galendromus occidentalis]
MLSNLAVPFVLLWAGARANRGVPVSEALPVDFFCFRRLNDTHQFGCSSDYNGNVGVVHVVRGSKDIEYVESTGPPTKYMALIDDVDLRVDTLDRFAKSNRVSGVLVTQTNKKAQAFSIDDTCPNRYSSFYKGEESCQKNKIDGNKVSSALLRDYPFPIFYVNETLTEKVIVCYNKFNKDTTQNSLYEKRKCSLKMFAPMNAAVDSKTCLRRTQLLSYFTLPTHFCDPLENKNVFALLEASEPAQETVIIAARLDSFSLFSGLAPGADSAVSGIVSLLTLAEALTKVKSSTIRNKNILFALFNGEAFDYIGSSRCILDLTNGGFAYNLGMDNITSIIELNQLFLTTDSEKNWFAHVDAEQYNDPEMRKKLDAILTSLKASGRIVDSVDNDLPPSSARRFLNDKPKLATVVLTNYKQTFANHYYNSIFDSYPHRISDIPKQSEKLQGLLASVGDTVLKMVAPPGSSPAPLEINKQLIDDLLVCYLRNSSCPRFQAVVNSISRKILREEPHSLYVSVSPPSGTTSGSTALTYLSLVRYSGRVVDNVTDAEACLALHRANTERNYTWMYGENPKPSEPGICVEHLATMTTARSPAFDSQDSDELHYSTWTESIWSQPEMSLFIQASVRSQYTALALGFVIFATSLLLSVLIYRKSDDIFEDPNPTQTPASPVAC